MRRIFSFTASSCKTPVNRKQVAICIWQFVHAWGTQQRYSLGITGRLKANWAQKLMYSPHHKWSLPILLGTLCIALHVLSKLSCHSLDWDLRQDYTFVYGTGQGSGTRTLAFCFGIDFLAKLPNFSPPHFIRTVQSVQTKGSFSPGPWFLPGPIMNVSGGEWVVSRQQCLVISSPRLQLWLFRDFLNQGWNLCV